MREKCCTTLCHPNGRLRRKGARSRLEVLGVILDLQSARMWLTPAKAKAYAGRVQKALEARSMERLEYLRLLGRLQFAAALYPRGRQWLHAAWRVARARFRLRDGRVQMTARVRADLKRWLAELQNF